jgi:hypothetical protein
MPPADLNFGRAPGLGVKVVGHQRHGIPASAPLIFRQDNQRRAVRVLLRGVNSGHSRRAKE